MTAPVLSFLRWTRMSAPAVAALVLTPGPAAGRCSRRTMRSCEGSSAKSLIRTPRSSTTSRFPSVVLLAATRQPAGAPHQAPQVPWQRAHPPARRFGSAPRALRLLIGVDAGYAMPLAARVEVHARGRRRYRPSGQPINEPLRGELDAILEVER